jgi:hypothetical protein
MDREQVDIDFQTVHALDIGRMKCIARFPVLAGDSLSISGDIKANLSQLRRPLHSDVKLDIFGFYVPYRYTYGEQWKDYIEKAGEGVAAFPTITSTLPHRWLQFEDYTMPLHLWQDVVRIWNYHFRDPSWDEMSLTNSNLDAATIAYGLKVAHLKSWGTAQSFLADMDDPTFDIDTSPNDISIFDLTQTKADAQNKLFRQFMSSRYQEIIAGLAGSEPHDYSDDVPELVWRESSWLNGYRVNGSSGAEFGAATGMGVGHINFNLPKKFFQEHGTFYIFAVPRMPPLFERAKQYLDDFNRPDGEVVPLPNDERPPVELNLGDLFFSGAGATSAGVVPVHEWYRDHPSYIDHLFGENDYGWQFLNVPTTSQALIESASGYDAMFVSPTKARHLQAASQWRIGGYRPIGSPVQSIMGSV